MDGVARFNALLKGNTSFDYSSLAWLEELLESHPYFHLAWLLYGVASSRLYPEGEESRERLMRAATLVPNASTIYGLLYPAPEISSRSAIEIEEESPQASPTSSGELPLEYEESKLSASVSEVEKEEEITENTETHELDLSGVLEHSLRVRVPAPSPTLFTLGDVTDGLLSKDFGYVTTQLNPMYRPPKRMPQSQSEAIDSFLNNLDSVIASARERAQRAEEQSEEPVDLSASSVVKQENLISERLAQLHLQRGETAEAITMYEQLKMKFPEKSSYFADIISRLLDGGE